MKRTLRSLFLFTFVTSSALAAPGNIQPSIDLPKEMVRSLDMVSSAFEAGYAPRAWKLQFAQWDLNAQMETLKAKINGQTNIAQYHSILKEFFNSTKDYHVGYSFYLTETATLPLVIRGAEGKYFLGLILRDKLPLTSFPFNEGDEVVEFDGKPIAEALAEVKAQGETNVEVTDQTLAELFITRRRASRGYKVPRGPVMIGIKKQGEESVKHVQLIWDYTPEKIGRIDGSKFINGPKYEPRKIEKLPFFNRNMMTTKFDLDEIQQTTPAPNKFFPGEKVSYLPELGKVIWRNPADKYFNAYIYQNAEKRLVGVIRIASYVPTVPAPAAVAEFASILTHFQATTDALVIDQLNNPGGSVFYLYALASMLSDQALYAPKHKMTILPSDVAEAVTLMAQLETVKNDEDAKKAFGGDDLSGYPVDYTVARFVLEFSRFIVEQWNAGKRLSDAYYLWGADKINPSRVVTYTKPIMVLVNELDFSGGDFFPTILQDNKRAKIVGTRTAGAGGYVLSVNLPNIFGIESFSYTGSIAERIDLNPIENLGVTPDVQLALTAQDFKENFVPFKNKVNEEVNKLFK